MTGYLCSALPPTWAAAMGQRLNPFFFGRVSPSCFPRYHIVGNCDTAIDIYQNAQADRKDQMNKIQESECKYHKLPWLLNESKRADMHLSAKYDAENSTEPPAQKSDRSMLHPKN